jgi:uncharacterized protein (TIGR02246 family)
MEGPTMDMTLPRTGAEDEVRGVMATWLAAARAKDVAGVMACYAEDVVSYDAVGALRFVGLAALGAHWSACMSQCSAMQLELREMRVEASEGLAFCHFLMDCVGVGSDGTRHECTLRGTSCLRREGGRWVIAHDHCSAPFDPMTMKALDSAPE